MQNQSKDIDAYIAAQPEHVRQLLEELRCTIREAAPAAVEVISYRMPAFKQNGVLVYFAAYKNHIGFYPTGSGIEAFQKELAGFKSSKGAVQFAIDQPLPLALVKKIVKYRVKQDMEQAALKKTVKKKSR